MVAFKTENAARQGDYFNGLATKVEASCAAGDDITRQLGDPQEASTRAALDFLAGRPCTAITASAGGITAQSVSGKARAADAGPAERRAARGAGHVLRRKVRRKVHKFHKFQLPWS